VPISPLEVIHQATLAGVHKEYPNTLNHSLHSDVELGNMRHGGSENMLRKYAQLVAGEMHDVQVA
jgi:hypothetical protein